MTAITLVTRAGSTCNKLLQIRPDSKIISRFLLDIFEYIYTRLFFRRNLHVRPCTFAFDSNRTSIFAGQNLTAIVRQHFADLLGKRVPL